MRLALLTAGLLAAAPLAAADLLDQEAVFARARELAVTEAGVEAADLLPFRIAYEASRLDTGDPAGTFDVDLLIRSSRSVLPADEVISAAEDPAAAARLKALLRGSKNAFHYRTVHVRFRAAGKPRPDVQLTTTLLNSDPEK